MKKIYIILLACVALGCSKDFEDGLNINPSLPSEATGTQLIANASLYLPGLSASPQGEFMAQYLGETQYVGASLYPEGGTSFYGLYQGPLMNLESVITSEDLTAIDGPVANQKAVASILKAYFFWTMTDRWGDIPYSQALQGIDNISPVYDTQESIYNSLFELLKSANAMMVEGSIDNDIVYGGNMDKWRKMGNTVRMLMALRLSEVDPAKAEQEFNAALAAGIMESNSDNLAYNYLADANNQNYWYGQVVETNREWWALTETLMDEMLPVNDPRLPVYGQPTRNTGEWVGMEFGQEANIGTEEFSLMGPAIYAQDATVHLVTYAQALFAQAEAAQRGWISGSAEDYYNQAIEASLLQWTGSTDSVESFLTQPEIAFDPERAMEQIATQRYVHLFMHGYEAWAEWRRTGYPDNLVAPMGKEVPTRLGYPDDEVFNNEANYREALTRQFGGEDSLYGNVWWDQ